MRSSSLPTRSRNAFGDILTPIMAFLCVARTVPSFGSAHHTALEKFVPARCTAQSRQHGAVWYTIGGRTLRTSSETRQSSDDARSDSEVWRLPLREFAAARQGGIDVSRSRPT